MTLRDSKEGDVAVAHVLSRELYIALEGVDALHEGRLTVARIADVSTPVPHPTSSHLALGATFSQARRCRSGAAAFPQDGGTALGVNTPDTRALTAQAARMSVRRYSLPPTIGPFGFRDVGSLALGGVLQRAYSGC